MTWMQDLPPDSLVSISLRTGKQIRAARERTASVGVRAWLTNRGA
jgi:hypothetical protein